MKTYRQFVAERWVNDERASRTTEYPHTRITQVPGEPNKFEQETIYHRSKSLRGWHMGPNGPVEAAAAAGLHPNTSGSGEHTHVRIDKDGTKVPVTITIKKSWR